MKNKIIILLAALLIGGISASPNRSCNGVRCATREGEKTTMAPVRKVAMMIDEAELMPMFIFLRNL
jgi:hypothetical protein